MPRARRTRSNARLLILLLAWAGFIVAVYCPDVGRGFVKDDFTWIRAAQTAIAQPSTIVLPKEPGFYRPLVTATFVLDYAEHAWRPRGYGWTNVGLYIACAFELSHQTGSHTAEIARSSSGVVNGFASSGAPVSRIRCCASGTAV